MPISFGRSKRSAQPDAGGDETSGVAAEAAPSPVAAAGPRPLNAQVLKEIDGSVDRRFTGALEVVDKATGSRAHIYFFEGGLYSVSLDGFTPDVLARLTASGVLDEGRRGYLQGVVTPGPTAVQQGWLTVDTLATVHQEYLLAALGAVLACDKVKIHARKGDETADFCTLPLPVAPLLESVRVRAQRLSNTLVLLSTDRPVPDLVLGRTGAAIPPALGMPEFSAIAAAVDGRATLDELGERLGLTRAETVHLTGLLTSAGVLAPVATTGGSGPAPAPTDRLLVPEAFGSVAIRASVKPVAAAPVPEPVAVPEPEAAVMAAVAAPVLAAEPVVEAVVVPEPVVVVEPEPEPTPEPAPDPVAVVEPEPMVVPEPVAVVIPAVAPAVIPAVAPERDDHVRQLRREMAEAEVAELREALDEAVVLEREAITRAAAVRARLREAEATLEDLSDAAGGPTE